jgi:plastocyanin
MRKLAGVLVVAALLAVPAVSALAASPTQKASVANFKFKPKQLSIKNGTKVTWTFNGVGIKHNVTVSSGPVKFHSANKSSGTYSFTFKKKGTYHLMCTIHPFMTETVTVR